MIVFVIFLVTITFCNSQNIGEILHTVRLRNVSPCPTSDDSLLSFNGTSTPYRTVEYWNGVFNISENFLIDKMKTTMQKCGEGFYPCEKFINVVINAKDMKPFMYSRGQLWTPLWNAIHPQPELPMIRKNSYRVINATIDVTSLVSAIPEICDHWWKIQNAFYTRIEAKHFCFDVDFSVIKFRLRPKKQKT